MKQVRCYLPNVILTFLLVFFLLAAEAAGFVKTQVLNADAFRTIVTQEALAEKAYTQLEQYFTTRYNSTGIPPEVYTEPMDKEALEEAITDSVAQAFGYLGGTSDSYQLTMDFTELEASVNQFFSDYAEENNIAKDTTYEEKVASVITEAEAKILFTADTFKFSVMQENGWLDTARRYAGYLNTGCIACIAAVLVLAVLLVLCNLRQLPHLLYWAGLSSVISAVLVMIPCAYVMATDYFAGFAIKDPQVFSAVVGLLRLLTNRLLLLEIGILVLGIVCFAVFGILQCRKRNID